MRILYIHEVAVGKPAKGGINLFQTQGLYPLVMDELLKKDDYVQVQSNEGDLKSAKFY